MGPDADIGNSPILVTLPNGRRALFAGTKAGEVVALDPDKNGALLFKVSPAGRRRRPAAAAARSCGAAPRTRAVYYGMGAAGHGRGRRDHRQDGVRLLRLPAPVVAAPPAWARLRRRSPVWSSRAPATDGCLRCRRRRQADLGVQHRAGVRHEQQGAGARRCDRHSGAVVVDGMVYVASGYAIERGLGGNVLLAFGVE